MYVLTSEGLIDIHERTHRNLKDFLSHARTLESAAFNRVMPGFGDGSVRLQFHHAIGAEKYWIGVLQGIITAEEDAHLYPTVASLERYREGTFDATQAYLRSASVEELNTPRPMKTWHGDEPWLYPGHVVVRTITHIYHHQGQLAAMLRILGSPIPGFNYPIR